MEYLKILGVVLGANGLWKFVEVLLRLPAEKVLKHAERKNLASQTDINVVSNWVQWSGKLEQRVRDGEELAQRLNKIIEEQRDQIQALVLKVCRMEKENKHLLLQLKQLKKNKVNDTGNA